MLGMLGAKSYTVNTNPMMGAEGERLEGFKDGWSMTETATGSVL